MRPIVIFGTGELAQLACTYFSHDSNRTVVAFTVDRKFATGGHCMDLPIVPFDEVTTHFPPDQYDMFVAVGYARLNSARAEKCEAAKLMGYELASYVSSRTSVWPDLQVGENCLVMEGNVIQPFVRIGNNVIVWGGCIVSHHVVIHDNVFVAAHAVISGHVVIGQNCFVGVNATIRDKVRLADRTIVGAGALILENTQENCSYLGTASTNSGIPSHRLSALL